MRALTKYYQIRILSWMIISLVLTTILLNLLLLVDDKLIIYFMWVNLFTGFTLVADLLLTWLTKKLPDKLKTDYVHKVFSKN